MALWDRKTKGLGTSMTLRTKFFLYAELLSSRKVFENES